MKLDKINEVWNIANLLFKWIFGLLSSKDFATMAAWRNDFSSLFITTCPRLVCYTAIFSVVTQRSSPLVSGEELGGALRDDTENGCVAD